MDLECNVETLARLTRRLHASRIPRRKKRSHDVFQHSWFHSRHFLDESREILCESTVLSMTTMVTWPVSTRWNKWSRVRVNLIHFDWDGSTNSSINLNNLRWHEQSRMVASKPYPSTSAQKKGHTTCSNTGDSILATSWTKSRDNEKKTTNEIPCAL